MLTSFDRQEEVSLSFSCLQLFFPATFSRPLYVRKRILGFTIKSIEKTRFFVVLLVRLAMTVLSLDIPLVNDYFMKTGEVYLTPEGTEKVKRSKMKTCEM